MTDKNFFQEVCEMAEKHVQCVEVSAGVKNQIRDRVKAGYNTAPIYKFTEQDLIALKNLGFSVECWNNQKDGAGAVVSWPVPSPKF